MSIKVRRYDWFDKVAMWRGAGQSSLERQAIGDSERTAYYFNLERFCHKITAETICQMQYGASNSESAT